MMGCLLAKRALLLASLLAVHVTSAEVTCSDLSKKKCKRSKPHCTYSEGTCQTVPVPSSCGDVSAKKGCKAWSKTLGCTWKKGVCNTKPTKAPVPTPTSCEDLTSKKSCKKLGKDFGGCKWKRKQCQDKNPAPTVSPTSPPPPRPTSAPPSSAPTEGDVMIPVDGSTGQWSVKKYDPIEAKKGDKILFKYGMSHDVQIMASKADFDNCKFKGATLVGGKNAGGGDGFELDFDEGKAVDGVVYVGCSKGSHCKNGMKVAITLTDI